MEINDATRVAEDRVKTTGVNSSIQFAINSSPIDVVNVVEATFGPCNKL